MVDRHSYRQTIHDDLAKKILGANSKDFYFKASRGWIEKFKKEVEFTVFINMERRQVQARNRQRSLKKELSDLIKAEGFVQQQVFDGDKTCLFFKKLPNRTLEYKKKRCQVINL